MHNRKFKQPTRKPQSTKSQMDSADNIVGPFMFTPNPKPLTEHIVKLGIKLWKVSDDKELEDIALHNLECIYKGVYYKITSMGYAEDAVLNAIMKNGHCYGAVDMQTNLFYNVLACFCTKWWHDNIIMFDTAFTSIQQLLEYSMDRIVCQLQQQMVPFHVSKREALWRIIIGKFHIGEACKLPSPESLIKEYDESSSSSTDGSSCSNPIDDVKALTEQCRLHTEAAMELIEQMYSEASKGFNLTRAMKSSMIKNVAIGVATFKANTTKTQTPVVLANISEDSQNLKNKAIVNSDDLSKFSDLSLDEKVGPMSYEEKQAMIVSLIDQIEGLDKQVKQNQEWANRIAVEAEKRLTNDMTELEMLRMERDKMQKLIKGKLVLDDATTKKMSHVENILRSATVELEQERGYMRKLEAHNAEIKAEIEACQLNASESNIASLQVAKREKKALKRNQALEKRLDKLQSTIFEEKRKTSELEELLAGIKKRREETQVKLKEVLKAKDEAQALVIMEELLKREIEAKINKKMEEAAMKLEINFQCHKDNVHKLKQEILNAKAATRVAKQQQKLVIRSPLGESREELNSGRKCIVCNTDEVSVLLLPCAHQVICITCCNMFEFILIGGCPICLTPVQQRIHVFRGISY